MMTFEELRNLLSEPTPGFHAIKECVEGLTSGDLEEMAPGPGHLTARTALEKYRVRAATTAEGGADTKGFPETLEELAKLPAEETVLLFHFSSQPKLFTVFVSESTRRIVGCLRVTRDPARVRPADWSGP